MKYDRLCICIPAYNEEEAIVTALEKLVANFEGAEIIVVDDGSVDSTAQKVSSVHGIRLIRHPRNIGYGGSLKTAMRATDRDVVAWYDADGQHRPEDLEAVVKPVLSGERDAVIGVRAKGSNVRLERLPGKLVLKYVSELVAGQSVPDLNSGLRAFKASVVRRYLHLLPDGFSASSTTTLLMMKRGYRLGYVDILTQKRQGKSTVKMLRDGWNALRLMMRILVLFEAFNFFTSLASLQIIAGLAYGIVIMQLNKMGFPVFAATVVISGVLTFLIGIVCDQVVEMRKEKFEDAR